MSEAISTKIARVCEREECGIVFYAFRSEVRRGKARFCSRTCRYLNRNKNRICKFPSCGKRFHASPSVIKKGAGLFCSLSCRDNYCKRPRADRFWEYVGRKNRRGCILWKGATDRNGYGKIDSVRAHRQAYELLVGPIPEGLCVLHNCDCPACICPTHLFLGTDQDNMADKKAKGRQAKGESIGNSKFTLRQAKEILSRHRAGGITQADLAREVGVTKGAVNHIVKGRNWKHLSEKSQ